MFEWPETVYCDVEDAVSAEKKPREILQEVVEVIRRANPLHSWVGIYYLRGGALELGPFSGVPTIHVRIPVGRGVCGTAVRQRRNQVVEDVRQCDNYLCCDEAVRSEIVVLIWWGHDIIGVIDVDSDEVGTFGRRAEMALDRIARIIAPVVYKAL